MVHSVASRGNSPYPSGLATPEDHQSPSCTKYYPWVSGADLSQDGSPYGAASTKWNGVWTGCITKQPHAETPLDQPSPEDRAWGVTLRNRSTVLGLRQGVGEVEAHAE